MKVRLSLFEYRAAAIVGSIICVGLLTRSAMRFSGFNFAVGIAAGIAAVCLWHHSVLETNPQVKDFRREDLPQ